MTGDEKQQALKELEALRERADEIEKLLSQPDVWEPEGGRWTLYTSGDVCDGYSSNDKYRNFGAEYKTQEQAEKARDMMLPVHLLIAYKVQYCPDAGYDNGDKWFIYFSDVRGEYITTNDRGDPDLGKIYFSQEIAQQLCDDLNAGRIPAISESVKK